MNAGWPLAMVLLATVILLHGASLVGSMPGVGAPENITVTFISPTSVKVFWATSADNIDKFDVTYKPTDASYRVVDVVAGNSEAVTLNSLLADTQYQVTVTAVRGGKKFRSRPIVFRTLEPPRSSPHQSMAATSLPSSDEDEDNSNEPPDPNDPSQQLAQVRGVEVGIVILVLIVWVGAIALFFNRWGKIRMLLPYQPDYKEQLKVPGTVSCVNGGVACPVQQHGSSTSCPQHHHWTRQHFDLGSWPGANLPPARPRINSAIFISSDLRDSEFLNHRPFRSELCRKTRSAENISLSGRQFELPLLSVSGPSPPEDLNDSDHHL